MTAPHYAIPLRVVNGRFATVEDASAADIGQSVGLLIATEPGERLTVPGYGVESSLFAPYVDVAAIQSQVSNWEPRAGKVNIEYDQNNESVKVTVSAEGGS